MPGQQFDSPVHSPHTRSAAPEPYTPRPGRPGALLERIGPDSRFGYWPADGRYRLYLSLSCPDCLGLGITHRLRGLGSRVRVHRLPTLPPAVQPRAGGYPVLRDAYRSALHGWEGPFYAPLLVDEWTGRAVSNNLPDIARDLATRFADHGAHGDLYPARAERDLAEITELCSRGITGAAQRAGRRSTPEEVRREALRTLLRSLAVVERRLAGGGPYLSGERITAADIRLWTTLLWLDLVHRWHLDATAVHRVAEHREVWAYARRLLALPEFHTDLRAADIERRHHHDCRGAESAGAAVPIVDWSRPRPAVAPPPSAERR